VGLVDAWPHLRELCERASAHPRVQVWLFGSALTSQAPSDLDVLLVYDDRADVVALRAARWWSDFEPPLRLIAMTTDEERHYRFIAATNAERLV
jgi:predicted nucleotidyltransferase